MKAKLTLTIDEEIIPKAKGHARAQGVSLSELVERSLAAIISEQGKGFADRWRGRLRPADRADDRYRRLARKYL